MACGQHMNVLLSVWGGSHALVLQIRLRLSSAKKTSNLRQILLLIVAKVSIMWVVSIVFANGD